MFFRGDFAGAAAMIEPYDKKTEGRDKIIYCMDRGIILHSAGEYKRSNDYLLEAAEIVRKYDLIHWDYEVGKFITNENLEDYRGEDYERILVHAFLALNYIGLNQMDEARIECKQIDQTLNYVIQQRGIDYKQSKFSILLSAMIYEELGEYNEALIDYKRLYNLDQYDPRAKEGLMRICHLLNWKDELQQWEKTFNAKFSPAPADSGELIVILESGLAPEKVPHPDLVIVPKYQKRHAGIRRIKIRAGNIIAFTELLDDIENNMVSTLDERFVGLLAKRAVALGVKMVTADLIAKEIEKKDKEAGKIVGGILKTLAYLSEKADTRGVYTFPADLQMSRIKLPKGQYSVELHYQDNNNSSVGYETRQINIEPGKKSWIIIRTVH
ncbi:MAG: hypothetical protein HY606_02955 [Planctomycetes bacterium]|nr:hypothetical protein [Planctomycetota bacterium]